MLNTLGNFDKTTIKLLPQSRDAYDWVLVQFYVYQKVQRLRLWKMLVQEY